MSRLDNLSQFDSSQWRGLDKVLERLEQALDRSESVDLNDLLPPAGTPSRPAYLLELVRAEINVRYRQHRGLPVENYLAMYPELGPKELVPVNLICEEYRARQLNGECPPLSLYQERFPERYPQLLLLLDKQAGPLAGTVRDPAEDAATPKSPGSSQWPDLDAMRGPTNPVATVDPTRSAEASSRPEARNPGGSTRPANSNQPASATVSPSGKPTRTRNYLPPLNLGEGGYEVMPPALGKGEFGEVFKAVAPGGVLVAVKRLFRPLDHAATQADLLALDKISKLNHPYLLQTHCYGQAEERLVIVMELADGSLLDRFQFHQQQGQRGIPVGELIPYFTQAAEALDFLHRENLMHRDIKPQNLLHLKGYAKVADFGLARTQASDLTRVTMMCGTPMYMPPEAWNQLNSIHSDQYSLAATYVEMRLGRPLFQCANPFELVRKHTMEKPKLEPLPAAEQRVLLKALAKEPDERYPSCCAFLEALARATASPSSVPVRSDRRLGRRLARRLAVALVLVLALVALGSLTWGALIRFRSRPTALPPVARVTPKVDWEPAGWRPVAGVAGEPELVKDLQGKAYFKRLEREVHGQRVEVVVIPQEELSEPQTFYLMTNKVWNALFAAFADGEKAECERLFNKYGKRPGCETLIRRLWHKGGKDGEGNDLGTGPGKEKWPVLRVTATEAHCFAEWLGGKLPSRTQWLKAAGALDQNQDRPGPFEGKPDDLTGLAIRSAKGPWPVDEGDRDRSRCGCRQMASNGQEWTRSEIKVKEIDLLPLDRMLSPPRAGVMGQSYLAEVPLIFEEMTNGLTMESVNEAKEDIGFRIVLQRE